MSSPPNDCRGISAPGKPSIPGSVVSEEAIYEDERNSPGTGKPLLLIHGLGGTWRSWRPVLNELAAHREVITIDLPGFGKTPLLRGKVSIATLADATTDFLVSHNLIGVDVVGSSMGARLVLELARRGAVGATVSLDPGGFWQGWERTFFATSIRSIDPSC